MFTPSSTSDIRAPWEGGGDRPVTVKAELVGGPEPA